jgi:hypothetical protein
MVRITYLSTIKYKFSKSIYNTWFSQNKLEPCPYGYCTLLKRASDFKRMVLGPEMIGATFSRTAVITKDLKQHIRF